MPANPLTLSDREEIRVGIVEKFDDATIGKNLGRHRSTIGREIERNGGRRRYRAVDAQARADRCRSRPKISKLVADTDLAAHVRARLKAKDSPKTISVELVTGAQGRTGSVSHETIYKAIYNRVFASLRTPHLRRQQRKHRGQRPSGGHSLGEFISIRDRPQAAEERSEIGHLEGDLIVGAYNRSALITVVDRKCRKIWLSKVASKTAPDVTVALLALLEAIPERLTLTWDQGSEIANHKQIAELANIDMYISDAKSPWQRPSNENANGHVRRYVGKGTDLNLITQQQLDAIEHRLNTTPRRIFNYATANDIYNQQSR